MAYYKVSDTDLTGIADKIRAKGGTSALMEFPDGYKAAVDAIPTGITPTGTKTINVSANGTTTHDVTNYASAQVVANVPNTYAAGDEGKVVSNGALVSQTSDTVTTNDTYDTTLINSLTVNVSGGGGDPVLLASETATEDVAVMSISYDANTMAGYKYFEMDIAGTSIAGRQLYPCPQLNSTSNKAYNGNVQGNNSFHFHYSVAAIYAFNSESVAGYRVNVGTGSSQQSITGDITSFNVISYYGDGGFKAGTVFKIWGLA